MHFRSLVQEERSFNGVCSLGILGVVVDSLQELQVRAISSRVSQPRKNMGPKVGLGWGDRKQTP